MLITDSFGRAWRHGQLDVAIGLAGMQPLDDWRGRTDASGLQLRATWLAVADAAAATVDLARAKDSREPVVIVDGLQRFVTDEDGPGAAALHAAAGGGSVSLTRDQKRMNSRSWPIPHSSASSWPRGASGMLARSRS